MPMDIATGVYSSADPVLQLQDTGSGITAVAGVTQTTPVASGPPDSGPLVGGVRDLTGERLGQLATGTADAAAAMSTAMDARNTMLGHYEAQVLPLGGQAGDNLVLPRVPEDASGSATPPAGGYLYGSGEGDQPGRGDAPGGTGNAPAGYVGNEPS